MAEGVLTEDEAQIKLANLASRKDRAPLTTEEPHPTPPSSLYNPQESVENGESKKTEIEDDILSYENMVLNKRRYLCSIPRTPDLDLSKHNETRATPEEEEKELVRASNRGWELLKSMDGNCLYFYSGWWSYSFCYGQGVRQFHQLPPGKGVPIYPPIEDKGVEAYLLGRYEDPEGGKSTSKSLDGKTSTSVAMETGLAKLEQKGDVRYLVQNLEGGTTCDLTGKPRRIEVQVWLVPVHTWRTNANVNTVSLPAQFAREDCSDQRDNDVCIPNDHRYATAMQRCGISTTTGNQAIHHSLYSSPA
jgi:protein OS-9